jgi:hypothetical protein
MTKGEERYLYFVNIAGIITPEMMEIEMQLMSFPSPLFKSSPERRPGPLL